MHEDFGTILDIRTGDRVQVDSFPHLTSVAVGDQAELAGILLRDIVSGRVQAKRLMMGDRTDIYPLIGSLIVADEGEIRTYDRDRGVWVLQERASLSAHVQLYSGTAIEAVDERTGRPVRQGVVKIAQGTVAGVLSLAMDQITREGFFREARSGFACTNGFVRVDPRTGEIVLEDHSPDHRAREAFPFTYDPHAECPRWKQFLMEEVFQGDSDSMDKAALLAEFVGGSVTGNATRFQKVLILRGEGANGKSVFLNVVGRLLPERLQCSIPPQQWGDDRKRAHMVGKLLNVVGELPESDVISSDNFKAIVAGDRVNAEAKYKDPYEFTPRMGHLFNANRLPGTRDTTRGFWRRFLVVEFNRSFEGATARDPEDLVEELCEELPGILAWVLRGVSRRIRQKTFTLPESHMKAVAAWRLTVDQVKAFAEECLIKTEKGGGKHTEAAQVYQRYKQWAELEGHKHIVNGPRFRDRLLLLGFEQGRPSNRLEWYATFQTR